MLDTKLFPNVRRWSKRKQGAVGISAVNSTGRARQRGPHLMPGYHRKLKTLFVVGGTPTEGHWHLGFGNLTESC